MADDNNYNNMLRVGTLLHGTYRIEAYLASGGFGNTYEATNVQFGERYAIKEFFLRGVAQRDANNTTVSISNSDNEVVFSAQREKFKTEAKLIRKLNNEHIVKLYDLFEENGTAYYVMEYIDGKSIGNILTDSGVPLNESTAIDYVLQVLDALREVHGHHFYHLDIKPSNIMISNSRAILIDFGSSKQMKEEGGATTDTPLSYTPGYAPSELMDHDNAKFGAWTDFYSLGATLYNMVSLQKPPAISDILEDGHEAFNFPFAVSDNTKQLIYWIMNVGRTKRPQSIEEIELFIESHYSGIGEQIKENYNSTCSLESQLNEEPTIVSENSACTDSYEDRETFKAKTNDNSEDNEDQHGERFGKNRIIFFSLLVFVCIGFVIWLFLEKNTVDRPNTNAISKSVNSSMREVKNKKFKDAKGNTFTYSGSIDSNGCPSGKGHGEYGYGIYDGNYKDGLKDGYGKFFESSGNIFTGTFSKDFYEDGEYYWKEANRTYKGTFYNEGQFCNGTWYDKSTGKETSRMKNGIQKDVY